MNLLIDYNSKSLIYQNSIPTHIPMAVFKCFVKMALSIMPESELEFFKDTIPWIKNSRHYNIFGSKKLICRYVMFPGYNLVNPSCSLYRINGTKTLNIHPYMLFNLTYGNFSYLIEIPTVNDIHQSIENIKFPPVSDFVTSEGILDLSLNKKKCNFSQSISFHFDSIEEIDKNSEKIKPFIN